jgi:hypothetical protein
MKSWAKTTCIPGISSLQRVTNPQLVETLSTVVLLDNNKLPNGLPMHKAPRLFLNALVAHDFAFPAGTVQEFVVSMLITCTTELASLRDSKKIYPALLQNVVLHKC